MQFNNSLVITPHCKGGRAYKIINCQSSSPLFETWYFGWCKSILCNITTFHVKSHRWITRAVLESKRRLGRLNQASHHTVFICVSFNKIGHSHVSLSIFVLSVPTMVLDFGCCLSYLWCFEGDSPRLLRPEFHRRRIYPLCISISYGLSRIWIHLSWASFPAFPPFN